MATVYTSKANYQPIVNTVSEHWVTISLNEHGRFIITSDNNQSVILDATLDKFERVIDQLYAIIITVESWQYKLNFSNAVSNGMFAIAPLIAIWLKAFGNNPDYEHYKKWLEIFEQHGIEPYRHKTGRAALVGMGIFLTIVTFFILILWVVLYVAPRTA